jgi:gliding motility-associated-like protein
LISFNGAQIDNLTTISAWEWELGDNLTANVQSFQHSYNQQGSYITRLWAVANNGCKSDTVEKTIKINKAFAYAGNDTAIIKNVPAQLQATGNGAFSWSPSNGLSNTAISNPFVTINSDQQFTLTVTTPEGCTADDIINIKVFNGPAIYVPSGFTPNGDGKNEILRPVYVGIKELKSFTVFNRWGQIVFRTNSMQKGWDGKASLGTYVWMIDAINQFDQPVLMKGTVTIIR